MIVTWSRPALDGAGPTPDLEKAAESMQKRRERNVAGSAEHAEPTRAGAKTKHGAALSVLPVTQPLAQKGFG